MSYLEWLKNTQHASLGFLEVNHHRPAAPGGIGDDVTLDDVIERS